MVFRPISKLTSKWRLLVGHGGGETISMLFRGMGYVIVHPKEEDAQKSTFFKRLKPWLRNRCHKSRFSRQVSEKGMSHSTMLNKKDGKASPKKQILKPISFGSPTRSVPHNASEVVPIGDSRLLFCDNNIGNALLELRLAPDGSMACPLIERLIRGIEDGVIDDIEGIALVENASRKYIFALPSLSLKQRKKARKKKSKQGKLTAPRSALLRILIDKDDQLQAEMIPDFRSWLIERAPELGKAHNYLPDSGGLNIEGLAWDPAHQALLLGVRTPVRNGRPLILRVRLKSPDGALTTDNFEMLPAITLQLKDVGEEQGIRAMEYDPSRNLFLIVIGNSTSASKAPFSLYTWDGNEQGVVRRHKRIRFHKRMKVEGVTHATIGGRGAIVFVDDAGGYQFIWDDDPRLSKISQPTNC